MEKVVAKIEVSDAGLREEVETFLKDNGYAICPYIVRIYDFINIAGSNRSARDLGIQCLHEGTIHNPRTRCLNGYLECRRYKMLLRHNKLFGSNR